MNRINVAQVLSRVVPPVLAALFALTGCDQQTSPAEPSAKPPAPTVSAPVVTSSVKAPGPKATGSSLGAANLPGHGGAQDAWLVVSDGAKEVGIIELRAGKAPVTKILPSHPDGTPLTELMGRIGGSNGLGLDMHIAEPGDKGMGENSTVIMRYGDEGYVDALKHALESKKYSVSRVEPLKGTVPEKFKKVMIERSGKPVGSIDFSKSYWAMVTKEPQVTVRFLEIGQGAKSLRTVTARPNEPGYPRAAVLKLVVAHYYDKKHGYELRFE